MSSANATDCKLYNKRSFITKLTPSLSVVVSRWELLVLWVLTFDLVWWVNDWHVPLGLEKDNNTLVEAPHFQPQVYSTSFFSLEGIFIIININIWNHVDLCQTLFSGSIFLPNLVKQSFLDCVSLLNSTEGTKREICTEKLRLMWRLKLLLSTDKRFIINSFCRYSLCREPGLYLQLITSSLYFQAVGLLGARNVFDLEEVSFFLLWQLNFTLTQFKDSSCS